MSENMISKGTNMAVILKERNVTIFQTIIVPEAAEALAQASSPAFQLQIKLHKGHSFQMIPDEELNEW